MPSKTGWDGEFGPFLETVNGDLMVNFTSMKRSDYVANGLAGRIRPAGLEEVTTRDMLARMEVLRACVRHLPTDQHMVSDSRLFLVSAERVSDWTKESDRGDQRLVGPGYRFVFALVGQEEVTPDVRRVRSKVKVSAGKRQLFHTQVAMEQEEPVGLAFKQDSGPFAFFLDP